MSPVKDSFLNLERHTRLLEENVAELTTKLEHWQLLEAEYEALLQDVQATTTLSPDMAVQQADLVRIRRDFDGQLVDTCTVAEIIGSGTGQPINRTPEQIANMIDRRLDYVRTNAKTLQKQVESAANKLAAAQVVSRPDMIDGEDGTIGGGGGDDGGGPITDIVEELDDDDNVVNVRLHTPSNTQPKVLDALKKAGIDKIPEGGPEKEKETTEDKDKSQEPELPNGDSLPSAPAPAETQKKTPAKKGVSFADDTKPGHGEAAEASSSGASSSSPYYTEPQSWAAQRLDKIMRTAKDQETMISTSSAVIPKGESEDDAALRREMLEYGMSDMSEASEIGPIVAELSLEAGSDDDEEYDYDEDEYDYDDDDEEDDFGRSKYSIIDEAYRERMRDLEKKLGVEPLHPPDESESEKEEDPLKDTDVGVIRVSGGDSTEDNPTTSSVARETPDPSPSPKSSLKSSTTNSSGGGRAGTLQGETKKVSFASELDIAPAELGVEEELRSKTAEASAASAAPAKPAEPKVDPLSDVIERGSSRVKKAEALVDAPTSKPAKKPSRFRMAREGGGGAPSTAGPAATAFTPSGQSAPVVTERQQQQQPQLPKGPHQAPVRFLDQDRSVAPEGPEGKTIADAIIERQPSSTPREPDELDATLLMQETAEAYHRTRNRLIQKQGGFLKASQQAIQADELIEVEDDGEGGVRPRRVSKFKAARLSQQ